MGEIHYIHKNGVGAPEHQKLTSFDQLLFRISSRLVGLYHEKVDEEIEQCFAMVGKHLNIDRIVLLQWTKDYSKLRLTHRYASHKNLHAKQFTVSEQLNWFSNTLLNAETIKISSCENIPLEACEERKYTKKQGIKAFLTIPCVVGDMKLGAISFDDMSNEKEWPDELVNQLQAITDVFANALARKRLDQEIKSKEAELRNKSLQLLEAHHLAHLGTWDLNLITDEVQLSEEVNFILGNKVNNSILSFDSFLDAFHPEDLEAFKASIAACKNVTKTSYPIQNRIIQPDLTTRVVINRFELICDHTGNAIHIVASMQDITELDHAEHLIVDQLSYESLLSDLSSNLINIPFDEFDERINDSLKKIAEILGFDRLALHQFSEDQLELHLAHFYTKQDVKLPASQITSVDQPFFTEQMRKNQSICIESLEDIPPQASLEKEYLESQGVKSGFAFPLLVDDRSIGAITFTTVHLERCFPDELVSKLETIGNVIAATIERNQKEQSLHIAMSKITLLTDKLNQEITLYQKNDLSGYIHEDIVGESVLIQQILEQSRQVANTDSTVIILGETGTGKDVLANFIHQSSARNSHQMVTVNCAALPSALIESELFGREVGAYTGALTAQRGRFELANDSTIFLDEIGEMPLETQTKLLRVLENGTFEKLGSSKVIKVNVRVIAATNRDLTELIQERKFREDLYYRLNVFPIVIPPLRERPEDIPLLAWSFIKEFIQTMGRPVNSVSNDSMIALLTYSWPGNVRELRNVIERAMIKGRSTVLQIDPLEDTTSLSGQDQSMQSFERNHIIKVLKSTGWRVRGSGASAEILSMNPSTLESKMKKLGIVRPGTTPH